MAHSCHAIIQPRVPRNKRPKPLFTLTEYAAKGDQNGNDLDTLKIEDLKRQVVGGSFRPVCPTERPYPYPNALEVMGSAAVLGAPHHMHRRVKAGALTFLHKAADGVAADFQKLVFLHGSSIDPKAAAPVALFQSRCVVHTRTIRFRAPRLATRSILRSPPLASPQV
jgi:hypothetical protein